MQQAPNADGLEEHTEQKTGLNDADWLEMLPGLSSNLAENFNRVHLILALLIPHKQPKRGSSHFSNLDQKMFPKKK